MSELINLTADLPTAENIAGRETKELYSLLAGLTTVHAKALKYMGMVWKELEARGEDLSSLRIGLAEWMPLIANDRLAAEAVIKFAGKKVLLHKLATLPIEKQLEIVDSPEVIFVERNADNGEYLTKSMAVSRMQIHQIAQVFDETAGKLRPESEQITLIARHEAPKKSTKKPPAVSFNGGFLKIGKSYVRADEERISVDQVVALLEEYYGIDIKSLLKEK